MVRGLGFLRLGCQGVKGFRVSGLRVEGFGGYWRPT